jgi:hypothetical protein
MISASIPKGVASCHHRRGIMKMPGTNGVSLFGKEGSGEILKSCIIERRF